MKWMGLAAAAFALSAPIARAQTVTVSGMVAHAGPMDAAALIALKQVSYKGSFQSMSGTQAHAWTGPLLLDVLDRAGLTDEPGKRTHIRHVILARGADGYAAALAIGEIDPKGEGKQILVALTQDGKALKSPRLVVPGDRSFTRSVHDLTVIEVR
jgi:DMSO/TMAO reductase YedYZ molybdopterin-dependent catalytic subunit